MISALLRSNGLSERRVRTSLSRGWRHPDTEGEIRLDSSHCADNKNTCIWLFLLEFLVSHSETDLPSAVAGLREDMQMLKMKF